MQRCSEEYAVRRVLADGRVWPEFALQYPQRMEFLSEIKAQFNALTGHFPEGDAMRCEDEK